MAVLHTNPDHEEWYEEGWTEKQRWLKIVVVALELNQQGRGIEEKYYMIHVQIYIYIFFLSQNTDLNVYQIFLD